MFVISLSFVSGCVALVIIIAVSLYIYGTWNLGALKAIGVDGPKPKPFIGNLIDMYSTEEHVGAYDLKQKMKYGRFVGLVEGRLPAVVVHDPDVIKEILVKEFNNFYSRRKLVLRSWMKNSLAELTDFHDWKRVRTIVTPFFSSGKLKQQTDAINRCSDTLLSNMRKASESTQQFEARQMMDAFTLDVICATAFGIEVDSQNNPDNPFITILRGLLNVDFTSVKIVSTAIVPHLYEFLEWLGFGDRLHMFPAGMLEFFSAATDKLINERRESKESRPDFVQALLHAQEEARQTETSNQTGKDEHQSKALSDLEIKAQSFVFFAAGFDTVATTLAFLAYNLAINQDAQDKVAAEVQAVVGGKDYISHDDVARFTYMDMCLDESQRLHPAVYRMDRIAAKDMVIKGQRFPKGFSAVIPIWSLHHDPELWEEPNAYKPERFSAEAKKDRHPYIFLPFGMGPRSCVGMRLAEKEMKIAMAKIISKYKLIPNDKTEVVNVFITSEIAIFGSLNYNIW